MRGDELMKVYIHNRKNQNEYEEAISVYSNRGKLLYSDYNRIKKKKEEMLKFEKTLTALLWGVKQFRQIAQNGVVSETEPVSLFMCSQTIYHWLEKESCPREYLPIFSDLQMELSLMVNDLEIIYSKNTKALYKSTQDKKISMKSFMKEFKDFED